MIKRVVEIASRARLSCRLGQLVIQNDETETTIPIEDIGFLILDNPGITHSSHLLSECMANQVAVLVCDNRHLPAGLFSPLVGHTTQAVHMVAQAAASLALKRRLWRQIVRAKITAQTRVLEFADATHPALPRLISQVRAGDPQNIEAQAARLYFRALFGDAFRRSSEGDKKNAMLNYGYAIVRAACARALVGAGLNPSLGIHHHNRYDAFCLADDIVEPLRPLVDWRVFELSRDGTAMDLDREAKARLLECLHQNCRFGKQTAPLMVMLQDYCASIRQALSGQAKQISFPTQQ